MFKFPTPPNTLVTLQIECVSCKETFSLAEDKANENPSPNWHIPSEQSVHTEIHHRPHLDRHLSHPLPRAIPENSTDPQNKWDDNKYEPVNCPRCGTDNRNWVRLAYAEPPGNYWQQQRIKFNKFSLIWIGYIVTAFLLIKLIWREWDNGQTTAYIFVFIMLLLAGILPILTIIGQWRPIRETKIENKYNTTRSTLQQMSPGIIQGGIYLLIFVVVIPLFVYIFMPQILGFFKTEEDLVTQIDDVLLALDAQNPEAMQGVDTKQAIQLNIALTSLQTKLNQNMFLCNSDVITTMITDLENLKLKNPTPETIVMADSAIYSLRQLQVQANAGECTPTLVADALYTTGSLRPTQAPGVTAGEFSTTLQATRLLIQENQNPQLHAQVSSQIRAIKKVLDKAKGKQTVPSTATLLSTWLKYVGLACLVSVITAVVATNSYISKINPHLPKPLCYNLRNLTRVAIWEARHSLETNGNFYLIEWKEVHRNLHGGVSLIGHLYPPAQKNPPEKIRCLRYAIYTDMWGHILTASSKSIILPPPPGHGWKKPEEQTEARLNHLFVSQNHS